MMLRPAWPKAGPTGGAGLACPAWMTSCKQHQLLLPNSMKFLSYSLFDVLHIANSMVVYLQGGFQLLLLAGHLPQKNTTFFCVAVREREITSSSHTKGCLDEPISKQWCSLTADQRCKFLGHSETLITGNLVRRLHDLGPFSASWSRKEQDEQGLRRYLAREHHLCVGGLEDQAKKVQGDHWVAGASPTHHRSEV